MVLFKKKLTKVVLGLLILLSFSAWSVNSSVRMGWLDGPVIDSLRELYSMDPSKWPKAWVDSGAIWHELAPLPERKIEKDSTFKEKVSLGRKLFFDPLLSGSNQISCSSCHDPELSWGDGRSVSLGNDHLLGTRNTLSLLNVAQQKSFFWDGRRPSLIAQAQDPIATHHEMAMDLKLLAKKIQNTHRYDTLYWRVYPKDKNIKLDHLLAAISAFELTIRSRKNRLDQFLSGKKNSLTDQEVAGLHIFRTKARCINCHNGAFLTDFSFHNIGLTYYKRKFQDLGRFEITHDTSDVGKFRTPMLRDVIFTGPWMHNGLFDDLTGIINLYNSGMRFSNKNQDPNDPLAPKVDTLIKPLGLTKLEKEALLSFLQCISAKPEKLMRRDIN